MPIEGLRGTQRILSDLLNSDEIKFQIPLLTIWPRSRVHFGSIVAKSLNSHRGRRQQTQQQQRANIRSPKRPFGVLFIMVRLARMMRVERFFHCHVVDRNIIVVLTASDPLETLVMRRKIDGRHGRVDPRLT